MGGRQVMRMGRPPARKAEGGFGLGKAKRL